MIIDSPVTLLLCTTLILLMVMAMLMASAIRIVPEHKCMDVYRLGRYLGEKGPGLILLIPGIDRGIEKDVGAVLGKMGGSLEGALGEAKTQVFTDGSVEVSGQRWDAFSERPIAPGARVRVKRVRVEVEEI